ncbi:DUF6622 family protein [Aestuariispira ectoiniformans]|uniref:DUF6622 family protein n=1 Tax=Aestuariispira ectoiniformans TaxID=2775080 RepID=UPI00223A859D|nr:DUF6622 family protein [Aestuariispira ectoiniformans]
MLEILRHTPSWVYIVFTAILYLGLSACFSQRLEIRRILYLPAVFIVLSVYGLIMGQTSSFLVPLSWVGGFAVATGGMYYLTLARRHRYSRDGDYLVAPGDPGILIVSMFFFAVKFWFGYTAATRPEWTAMPLYPISDNLCSGLVVGFFGGRGLAQWSIAKKRTPEELVAPNGA